MNLNVCLYSIRRSSLTEPLKSRQVSAGWHTSKRAHALLSSFIRPHTLVHPSFESIMIMHMSPYARTNELVSFHCHANRHCSSVHLHLHYHLHKRGFATSSDTFTSPHLHVPNDTITFTCTLRRRNRYRCELIIRHRYG